MKKPSCRSTKAVSLRGTGTTGAGDGCGRMRSDALVAERLPPVERRQLPPEKELSDIGDTDKNARRRHLYDETAGYPYCHNPAFRLLQFRACSFMPVTFVKTFRLTES